MSNYRRFITYLFRYENGEKMEQCGFARVELRQNLGKIEFHIRDCKGSGGELLPCFFAEYGQVRIPIGKILVKGTAGEGSFRFDCVDMGDTKYDFSAMRGIVIPLDDRRLIVSQWDDEVYDWERLMRWDEPKLDRAEPEEVVRPEEAVHTTEDVRQEEVAGQEEAVDLEGTTFQNNTEKEMAGAERVLASMSIPQQIHEMNPSRPCIYPFDGDQTVWAVQAQLWDLKNLPQNYWQLCNNSFVLRGYCRYGSILIGYMEKEKACFLGVPGMYHRQERMIASLFGFDHFRGKSQESQENGCQEEQKSGDFGYWYKLLDVVS